MKLVWVLVLLCLLSRHEAVRTDEAVLLQPDAVARSPSSPAGGMLEVGAQARSVVTRQQLLPFIKKLMSYPGLLPVIKPKPLTAAQRVAIEFNITKFNDTSPATLQDIDALVKEVQAMQQMISQGIVDRLRQDQNDALAQLNITRTELNEMRIKIAQYRGLKPPLPTETMQVGKVQQRIERLERRKLLRARTEALRQKKLELKRERLVKKIQQKSDRSIRRNLAKVKEVQAKQSARVSDELHRVTEQASKEERRVKYAQIDQKRKSAYAKLRDQRKAAREMESKAESDAKRLQRAETRAQQEKEIAARAEQSAALERTAKVSENEEQQKKKLYEQQQHALQEEEVQMAKKIANM